MSRDGLKEARRVQLIEATIDCIAKRGFSDLTLAQVAEAARLSVGIVNFYFKSKDVLLIATLKHLVEDYRRQIDESVAKAGPSPTAQINAMLYVDFHRTVANRKQVTVWYAFWGETRWRPEFLRICSELSAAFQTGMAELFRRIIADGGYADIDPELVARGYNAMIDGLWLDMLINPKETDREIAKATVRTFLAGLFPNEFKKPVITAASAA